MILSKQFFNLFHAYARKNNMWILDQPLSAQLPDQNVSNEYTLLYTPCSKVLSQTTLLCKFGTNMPI